LAGPGTHSPESFNRLKLAAYMSLDYEGSVEVQVRWALLCIDDIDEKGSKY